MTIKELFKRIFAIVILVISVSIFNQFLKYGENPEVAKTLGPIAYIFAIVCVTSPPVGILLGGIIGNKIGGYTNKKSIIWCIGSVIIFCVVASACPFMNNAWLFAADIWIYLFFSSAVIPLETGIIINSLQPKLRGDGFSVMNFLLNLTGNLPASYVYGLLDDNFKEKNKKFAMTVCMLYNWFSLVTLSIAAIFRYRKKDPEEAITDNKEMHKDEPILSNSESVEPSENESQKENKTEKEVRGIFSGTIFET